jgi:hypothetical protein
MRHERRCKPATRVLPIRLRLLLMSSLILCPLSCLPTPDSSSAAEPAPDATIVVSAEPVSEAEKRAPTSFVDVIDTSQYEGQFETATSVLAQAVGVQVRRFGGLGGFSTLSIRGSNPNQVRFYLDGIPLTSAGRDVINLATLPIDSLERFRSRGAITIGADGRRRRHHRHQAPTVEPHTEVHLLRLLQHGEGQPFARSSVGGYDLRGHLSAHRWRLEFLDNHGTDFDPNDTAPRGTPPASAIPGVDGLIKARKKLDDRFFSTSPATRNGSTREFRRAAPTWRSTRRTTTCAP